MRSQSRNAVVRDQLRRPAGRVSGSVNVKGKEKEKEKENATEVVTMSAMVVHATTIPVLSRALSRDRSQIQGVGAMTSK